MSKKNIGLAVVLLGLIVIYIINFTDLFREPKIEISPRLRPQYSRHRHGTSETALKNTISFSLDNKYKLTSVKVVEAADLKTNKYPHAIWHLISESNSVPTKAIYYGTPISGMKPEFEKAKPEALQPEVSYVLFLEAGELKGQTTFEVR